MCPARARRKIEETGDHTRSQGRARQASLPEAEEGEKAVGLEQHAGDRQHRRHVPEAGLVAQGGDSGREVSLVHRVNQRNTSLLTPPG